MDARSDSDRRWNGMKTALSANWMALVRCSSSMIDRQAPVNTEPRRRRRLWGVMVAGFRRETWRYGTQAGLTNVTQIATLHTKHYLNQILVAYKITILTKIIMNILTNTQMQREKTFQPPLDAGWWHNDDVSMTCVIRCKATILIAEHSENLISTIVTLQFISHANASVTSMGVELESESESLIWRRLRLQALSVSSGLLCNFVAIYLTFVQFISQLKLRLYKLYSPYWQPQ